MPESYTFEIVIEKEVEAPGYFAWCPALQGCFTQGETIEETREHMVEALTLHLECLRDEGDEIPKDADERVLTKLTVTL